MKVDVRTKLLITAALSSLALVYQRPGVLAALFICALAVLLFFKVNIRICMNFKHLLLLYFGLIIVQSFFVKSGTPLVQVDGIYFLTTDGLIYGCSITLRFLVLVSSGLLLTSCNTAELMVALVKMKMPYEIVFMIQLGIRFVPVLMGEIKNTLDLVQLRGVELNKVYKRKVIKVYVGIFSPLIYTIWEKAVKLSTLLELRGFRKHKTRTYYRSISFRRIDYYIIFFTLVCTAVFIYVAGLPFM